ncbi:MAG: hypothetical protein ACR2QH_04485 [Geminicoccaceae bacterium]|jgi:hypothetical protein
MQIEYGSVHYRILDHLCAMPKAVRGMSGPMLQRLFGGSDAIEDLAASGLIKKRGWADGPGSIWVPTAAGEALLLEIKEPHQTPPPVTRTDRVILP